MEGAAIEAFGYAAVCTMVVCYALEHRSPHWTLGFAGSCLASAGYAWAIGSLPFALLECVWAMIAFRRWRRIRMQRASTALEGWS